jgi:Mg2+ and Co2+ transporter CorA
MEAVRGHLLLTNCLEDELTRPNIELAMKADRLLWLDLEGTDDEVLTLLHEVFKIHPLAVEDVREFHQRPKIEDYDDFVSIVVYGARALGEPLTEVHCFYAERFLVSVHRDEVPAVADACHTLGRLHTDRAWSRCTGCSTRWWTPCSRTWPRWTSASTSCKTRSS